MTYQELIDLESSTQSQYSPCIISNDEVIARILFSPNHYHNGEILPSAFEDIFKATGFSVLRKHHDFDKSLKVTIADLHKPGVNEYFGYVCARVSEIRAIILETLRLFYILDTATKRKLGHSDVFSIRTKEMGSKSWVNNYIRSEISLVFNDLVVDAQIESVS